MRHGVFAFIVIALAAGCAHTPEGSGAGEAGRATLTGTVTYLQRIALPPDAEITVSLADVSRADAAAVPLGSATFKADGRQVPLSWAIAYDPSKVDERMTYAVSARITVGGKLAWISDTRTPALTRGAPKDSIEVRVRQVAE
jgi:putative lipoprotein